MHRAVPLGIPHALRAGVFGIVFALSRAGDLAEDGAACSAGEMNHGTCFDY